MTDFNNILQTLLLSPENEVVEFKEAKNSFDVNELGKYFSALSNEANLRGTDFAWLVFGVADKTREIVGTSFKNSEQSLQECIWLDAVQKHKPVTPLAIRHLKAHGLIEGRSPYYTISLSVAQITHQLPHYNKVKGLEKERLFQMIGQFVSSTDKGATRAEMMEYVSSVLPATKNEEQKYKHLSNILKEMKGKRLITSNGKHWWPNSAKPTEND